MLPIEGAVIVWVKENIERDRVRLIPMQNLFIIYGVPLTIG